jgi:hypothetical protein
MGHSDRAASLLEARRSSPSTVKPESEPPAKDLAERRNVTSSIFIAMLLGIAYQEMLNPVRDSIRTSGLTAGTAFLALCFFFTSLRFFIGNQLHLLSKGASSARGDVWLYDFVAIVVQSILFCFLGGACSPEINRATHINFYEISFVIYLIDILWILSQAVLPMVIRPWKRGFIPWAWAALNLGVLLVTVAIYRLSADPFGTGALGSLLALNIAGFIVDMVLVDQYSII